MSSPPPEPPPPPDEPIELGYAAVPRKPRVGLALVAFILGLAGLLAFIAAVGFSDALGPDAFVVAFGTVLGFIGLLFGVVALVRIRRDPTRRGGREMAIAGILTGAISTLILASIVLPSYVSHRSAVLRIHAIANLADIGRAMRSYYSDRSVFPDELQSLVDYGYVVADSLRDPCRGDPNSACDFYYVAGLSPQDPPDWIIAYGDPYPRDQKRCVLRVDGSVTNLTEPRFSQELQRFRAEFEETYGKPPVIIKPP